MEYKKPLEIVISKCIKKGEMTIDFPKTFIFLTRRIPWTYTAQLTGECCSVTAETLKNKTSYLTKRKVLRYLGKPPSNSCWGHLGIALLAFAPPPPHSNGHSGALFSGPI